MKNIKWTLILFVCTPILLIAQGEWTTLKTGAGGWITGMDIHPDGTLYVRSDVGGAYRLDPGNDTWKQIVTHTSMPSQDVDWSTYSGVLSIATAPSQASRTYMAYYNTIYASDNKGENWYRTNFDNMDMAPNDDASKLFGERLEVDPQNEDVVYFGSINDGLFRTEDGMNWTAVNSLPAGTAEQGVRSIAFDESSTVANGKTQILYIAIDGEGIFQSMNGGVTFTNITNTLFPNNDVWIYDMEIDANGHLYISGRDGFDPFGVYVYRNEEWEQVFTADLSIPYTEIALDPFNADRVVVFSEGYSETYVTENASAENPTWTYKGIQRSAENIPWLAWTQTEWFTLGEAEFDPIETGRIWVTFGTGTFYIDLSDEGTYVWNEFSKGQEHLVSNDVLSFSNGNKLTAHWDFPMFMHTPANEYPTQHLPSARFNSCWDLSQSPTDEQFVVALIEDIRYCCYDDETRNSGYSEDGGQSWTRFPSMPGDEFDLIFGQLEVSAQDNNNIIWLPGQNRNPYYTLDKGTTWTEVDLPGDSDACCLDGPWFKRKALAADKQLQGTFYLYDWGSGDLFTTEDGGVSWTRKAAVLPAWSFHGKLLSVQGQEGHMFFSNGPEEDVSGIEGLLRSTDYGESWIEVEGTSKVINVSIGKEAPGSDYPSVFICGEVDGVYGYYLSTDNCNTWEMIGDYPMGIYDWPIAFEANPYEYGNVVVGFAGNGFATYSLPAAPSAEITERIHIDQFGYQPAMTKVAVFSDPQIGYNSDESYTPGNVIQVIQTETQEVVFSGSPEIWNEGNTHDQSGDKGWQFDFSSVTTTGTYYIMDVENNVRSYEFEIQDDVYNEVLQVATKMFYYNRCNMAKEFPFAEMNWTDGTNFNNDLQDGNARYIYDQGNASLERDMTGGWFDAGDYNKYVTFAHGAIHNLLSAYDENPSVFSDGWNLPESGNGIPDLLDEINWELQWLEKMMNEDGSVHIKIGSKNYNENVSYPPSANTDQRYYGPECSAGSVAVASMFAHAAWTYNEVAGLEAYGTELQAKASSAFAYYLQKLEANDLDTECDDGSIVSGDADWDEAKQKESALIAAVYLYDLTGDALYGDYIIEHVNDATPINQGWLGPYTNEAMEALFLYTTFPTADQTTSTTITSSIFPHVSQDWNGFFGQNDLDLYRAYMPDFSYHWGSNQTKADYANLNKMVERYDIHPEQNESYAQKAEEVIHYYHGINPLTKVYLSNMYDYGAENSVDEIYHGWFADGSEFDNALTSLYGPAPGYVPGGPNNSYTYPDNNPPYGQPSQKAYADFNGTVDVSWEITEPAIYYQAAYVRMLANYAIEETTLPVNLLSFDVMKKEEDAELIWTTAGTANASYYEVESSTDGTNFSLIGDVDAVQNSTSIETYTFLDIDLAGKYGNVPYVYYRLKMFDMDGEYEYSDIRSLGISSTLDTAPPYFLSYPNPTSSFVTIGSRDGSQFIESIVVYNQLGQVMQKVELHDTRYLLDLTAMKAGSYVVEIKSSGQREVKQIIKM